MQKSAINKGTGTRSRPFSVPCHLRREVQLVTHLTCLFCCALQLAAGGGTQSRSLQFNAVLRLIKMNVAFGTCGQRQDAVMPLSYEYLKP